MAARSDLSVYTAMNRAAALAVCVVTVFLSGCPQEWHFAVINVSDPSHPSFCISQRSNCRGAAVSFPSFVVSEVDERGRYVADGKMIRPMWIIEPVADVPLREVRYGRVPEGWRETKSTEPLQFDKFYSANGKHFFRIARANGEVRAEVLTVEEFLARYYK
jgi:hypothetical protein